MSADCPFCDPLDLTIWGMGPEGWADMRREHDKNHGEIRENKARFERAIPFQRETR